MSNPPDLGAAPDSGAMERAAPAGAAAAAAEAPGGGEAQIVNRLLGELMLRRLMRLRTLFGGNVIMSLVTAEILAANESGLDKTAVRGAGVGFGTRGAHALRPASALSIANALGMPYETIRRHVRKLEQLGLVRRVVGGVEIKAEVLERPEFKAEASTAIVELKRLIRDLRSAGVDLG